MLQEDPVLFQLYKDLVVSQVISADEFWANRLGDLSHAHPALNNSKQEVGISGAFLVSPALQHPLQLDQHLLGNNLFSFTLPPVYKFLIAQQVV